MSDSRELPFGLMSAKDHALRLKPYSNMGIAAGLVIDAADIIEQQHQTITDLCTALDNVLSHTSTDTIAEAAAVLERVRGEAK